ncbi:Protein tssc1 [Coemansia aciculifera]|nr:Protein tssc1 [Coemansia aciculifera]
MAESLGGSTSHVYGIDLHTLCLTSIGTADESQSQFALGTLDTQGDGSGGEIHIVNLHSSGTSSQDVLHSTVFKHTTGIRALAAAPWNASQLVVVSTEGLVELVSYDTEASSAATRSVAQMAMPPGGGGSATRVACHRMAGVKQTAVVVAGVGVVVWDTVEAVAAVEDPHVEAVAWHPTSPSILATSDSLGGISTRDLRSTPSHSHQASIECAHTGRIRALDYNPNLPYHLASGGSDGALRIWDLRHAEAPLITAANHSHWVCDLQYNPFYDQLLLSAGSDALVNLESAVSVSSATLATTHDDDEDSVRPVDGLVMQYDDHESSVYAVQWSATDPWVFASLSFDGRLVINAVPREEKYKILL